MKKILLIEDNLEVRENIAELLELANYTVNTAQNGKEGVKLAKELLPDLIICDIMMPELDGYGVLQLLSRNPSTNAIPFIFLTAKTEKSDFRKGMNLGADDYLTKPFEEIDLINAIESRLNRSKNLKKDNPSTVEGLNSFIQNAKITDLVELKKTKKYLRKEVIFREGDLVSSMYLLQSGKVKLSVINEDGKELITEWLGAGDYFGYRSMFTEKYHTLTATVSEDAELCVIPKAEFMNLIDSNHEVASVFIKMLSKDLEEREQELIDLAYNTVRKRVADSLLKLKERYQEDNQQGKFTMVIPRGDLASMVGTAKESVIRFLSEFKDEGLISIQGSSITILDEKKLLECAN